MSSISGTTRRSDLNGCVRIGIDATCCFNRRGYGRFTRQLLHEMVRRHPQHKYVCLVDQDPPPGTLPEGVEVVNANPARKVCESAVADGRRTLGEMYAFTRLVRRIKADVFFFPAIYSFFPVPPGTRSVVCIHDTIAENLPELIFTSRTTRWAWRAKVRVALWQATRVMTVSESSRAGIQRHFGRDSDLVTEGPSNIFGLGEPDSIEATLRSFGLADRPYVLFVGGISPHKNLTTLISAMKAVREAHDVRLVIVGDSNADGFRNNAAELQAQIDDAGVRESCVFMGFLPDDQLADLYRGARCLVFPSLCEGFGLPAIEAMACGTAVLASDNSSLPEVVGDAGLFFDPLDATEMGNKIIKLLDDEELRAELERKGLERSRGFTWELAADMAMKSLMKAATHGSGQRVVNSRPSESAP